LNEQVNLDRQTHSAANKQRNWQAVNGCGCAGLHSSKSRNNETANHYAIIAIITLKYATTFPLKILDSTI